VIRGLVYPVWMLVFVGVALARGEVVWCVAAGVLALGLRFAAARAWRTASGRLALANLLTLFRLGLVASLPWCAASFARPLFALLVVAMLVLDGVDGLVARTRGEESPFGALFDMETDALTVMVLCLLLHAGGVVGPWVLVAGLLRYAYAVAITLHPALGDCPRSPIYRWIFCVLMVALAGAFLPWPQAARAFAAFGTLSVSLSFTHSLVRSRAVGDCHKLLTGSRRGA
jgi:phosphatidylglycerophosphate synthase